MMAACAPPGKRSGRRDMGDEHDLVGWLGTGTGNTERHLAAGRGVDRARKRRVFEGERDGDARQNGRRQGCERDPKLGGGCCHLVTA